MAGRTGLCYAGVRAHLEEMGHTGQARRDIYDGIRAAEAAILEVWATQAEQARQQQAH